MHVPVTLGYTGDGNKCNNNSTSNMLNYYFKLKFEIFVHGVQVECYSKGRASGKHANP